MIARFIADLGALQPHAAVRLARGCVLTNRVMSEPDFAKRGGLVTAIAQDAGSGEILMVAYMNDLAWRHTLETGRATYWSTSRHELWVKGESSGHIQHVKEIFVDCDADCVLLKVDQTSAACHEGYRSCFFRKVEDGAWRVVAERIAEPNRG
jgi:phosphoribosyl-AMP cyclohydrolase